MKCMACQKEMSHKDVLYTADKKSYCPNPFTCNDLHPNSVANIVERGGAVKLYTANELEENIFERLDISEALKNRILKIATKPQSIRLNKYEIAYYLLQLQAKKGLSSISEAVRYCILNTMHQESMENVEPVVPEESSDIFEDLPVVEQIIVDPIPDPKPVEVRKGIKIIPKSDIVVPEIPKSVNVDWNNLPKLEPVTVPELEDDDEDTF